MRHQVGLFVIVALLLTFAGTAQAAQAQQSELPRLYCAVQFVNPEGPELVIISVGGSDEELAAGFCGNMLATGNWVGASANAEWEAYTNQIATVRFIGHPELRLGVYAGRTLSSHWLARYATETMALEPGVRVYYFWP